MKMQVAIPGLFLLFGPFKQRFDDYSKVMLKIINLAPTYLVSGAESWTCHRDSASLTIKRGSCPIKKFMLRNFYKLLIFFNQSECLKIKCSTKYTLKIFIGLGPGLGPSMAKVSKRFKPALGEWWTCFRVDLEQEVRHFKLEHEWTWSDRNWKISKIVVRERERIIKIFWLRKGRYRKVYRMAPFVNYRTFFICLASSVTRLGDFLDFGQLFKAFGSNWFAQISYILRQFL